MIFVENNPAPGHGGKRHGNYFCTMSNPKHCNEMEPLIFYALLCLALLVIAGLVALIVYYRRKLDRLRSAMVRCVNENLEMKEKLLEFDVVYHSSYIDLTSEEFIRIMNNMLKRLVLLA